VHRVEEEPDRRGRIHDRERTPEKLHDAGGKKAGAEQDARADDEAVDQRMRAQARVEVVEKSQTNRSTRAMIASIATRFSPPSGMIKSA